MATGSEANVNQPLSFKKGWGTKGGVYHEGRKGKEKITVISDER
jgi:hypothetical protein